MMASSPFKTSPLQTGRLSLLSSDIEEDLGLIDFNDSQFNFLSKNEFWLFDEPIDEAQNYDNILDWINSCFPPKEEDPYFAISSSYTTPTNGLERFDYLTKTVSRTATITRRRIENDEVSTPQNTRFGTITKRPIQQIKSPIGQSSNINRTYEVLEENGSSNINRTYEVLEENGSSETATENLSDTYSDSPVFVTNKPSHIVNSFLPNSRLGNINTNTITKNRRLPVNNQNCDSSESDFIDDNVGSDLNSTYGLEEMTANEISNNADLNRQQANRTFDKSNSDTDNSISASSKNSPSSRNYPTISRNITRTLLRREGSQGQLAYTNQQMKQPQAHFTTSNDDLLSSDSSSVFSGRSNLTMTSSISGRSEPNLAHNLTVMGAANSNKKVPTRPVFGANKPSQLGSKIGRPSSQNGPTNGLARKPAPSANGFGSMSSLQSNMARTSSQTTIGLEMTEDSDNGLLHGSSSKLLSAISRNSTFRVHRPSPIVNVASVFADQPVTISRRTAASPIKYNSDDNILHCSQEEIDEFRAKVLNSSNSNLRTIHAYQPQPVSHHNNRSDSPSSNSSSCSSHSSSSRMRTAPNATSLANRLNNNGPVDSLGSSDNLDMDSRALGLKYASNNNNHNTTFTSNNNLGLMPNGITNSKTTSRIPALPKSIATSAPNRSGIPISGLIPPRTNANNHEQTLLRKSKLAAGYQGSNTSKLTSHHLITNKLMDENAWQNDCF